MTIDDTIEELERVGWLGYLSASKRARLKKDLGEWYERATDWTYLGLATASFDTEAIEDTASYPQVLRAYRNASSRIFDPRAIESRIDHQNETAFVAFTLKGQRFEAQLSLETGDYVAEDFEPFINKCLDQVGIEQRFFTLPVVARRRGGVIEVDSCAHLVFVPPAVYAAAEAAGVIPSTRPASVDPAPSRAQELPRAPRGRQQKGRLRGEWTPLPLRPGPFLAATGCGVGAVVALIKLAGAPWLLVLGTALVVALMLFGAMLLVRHPFAVLTTYQWMMYAFMIAATAAIVAPVAGKGPLWVVFLSAAWVFLVWQGADPTS